MYTQIPNELFDYLPSLSGAAIKVLMIVARRTYGWHKSTAQISMNTFEELTGLSRSSVARAITELGNAGLLHVQKLKIDNVNEINCYEILLPVENSDKPVENSNEGSSKMKLPPTKSSQAENKTAHTVQELSTGEGGSSKIELGVVLKSNLYKEKYKERKLKKEPDKLALVENHDPVVAEAKPDMACPTCGVPSTQFELQRYGSCQFCFVKSTRL